MPPCAVNGAVSGELLCHPEWRRRFRVAETPAVYVTLWGDARQCTRSVPMRQAKYYRRR